ncbi:MAG: OB-fold nucleic acid binding domain-containing protein [Candidatus Aenigmarchaeota archaeon]|nr:OB-fold nucleic acid binding domain-containing protein [Candidatus Aenigmarchaeota archaeon]
MEYKQLPAKEMKISDITSSNMRVRLTGTVISKEDNGFMLDDTTGAVKVICEKSTLLPIAEKSTVQALGWVSVNANNEIEIRADIITNLIGLNLKLYRRTLENITKN